MKRCRTCKAALPKLPRNRQGTRYCSDCCRVLARIHRFRAKIDTRPGHGPWGDCHLWLGAKDADGYGRFAFEGHMVPAHSFSWELAHGEMPKGLLGCHKCDNPPCVNEVHIFPGTHADNNADTRAKGRSRRPTFRGWNAKVNRYHSTHPMGWRSRA